MIQKFISLSSFPAQISRQDKENAELKKKITEMMALAPPMGAAGFMQQQPPPSPAASLFAPRTTLSLDLPAATDLSFTGKMGHFDSAAASAAGPPSGDAADSLFGAGAPFVGNGYAKTNGKVNE